VRDFWPLLVLLALSPLGLMLRYRRRPEPVRARPESSVEAELRRLVSQSPDAAPGRVSQALRRRGIAREEAEAVGQWLAAMDRHRWGPDLSPPPDNAVAARVVARLRRRPASHLVLPVVFALAFAAPLHGQWGEALARFGDGDGAGAARLFEQVTADHPAAPAGWFNLGAARWAAGDEVGSVAAWLQGSRLAPRDRRFREALSAVPNMPRELGMLSPTIPMSRDELILLALVGWLVAAACWRRRRTLALFAGAVALLAVSTAALRIRTESADQALIRGGATLRVSPVPSAPALVAADPWSVAVIRRAERDWRLVELDNGRRGWLPAAVVAPLAPLD
jgi:hypothetical protein